MWAPQIQQVLLFITSWEGRLGMVAGMAAHAFNPSTQQAEAEGSL